MPRYITTLFYALLLVCQTTAVAENADSLEKCMKNATDSVKYSVLKKLSEVYGTDSLSKSVDYLRERLKLSINAKNLQEATNSCIYIAELFWAANRLDSARENYNLALSFAIENSNNDDQIFLYNSMGMALYSMSYFDSALACYNIALGIADKLADHKRKAKIFNNIGNVYARLGDYEMAVRFYLESASLKEVLLNNKVDGQDEAELKTARNDFLKSLMNIGSVYSLLEKDEVSLEYFNKALALAFDLGDKGSECKILNNIGTIMNRRGNYKEALELHQKALNLRKLINDKKGISVSYHNIANVYRNLKDYENALEFYFLALEIKKESGDRYGIATTMMGIGKIYIQTGRYAQASVYLYDALRMSLETNSNMIVAECYELLATLNQKTGKYQEALTFLKRYDGLMDSIGSEEHNTKIAGMQVRYEADKKERDNELLRKEVELNAIIIKKQSTLQYYFSFIAFLIILAGILTYNLYRVRRKTSLLLLGKNIQLQKSLNEYSGSETRLRNLNATKEKLLRIISHDIKNPLGSFVSLIKILSTGYHEMEHDERVEFLYHTVKSCRMTAQLLDNLSEWSNLQRENIELKYEWFDLSKAITESIQMARIRAEEKRIEIVNLVPTGADVFADYHAISTVFRNLISNAVKFSPEGEDVCVDLQSRDGGYLISVKDNGIGMEKEDLGKLFRIDTNYSSIGNSGEKGTGLGLIICKEIIQRLKGSIFAESEPGKGSIFYVFIPHMNQSEK